MRGTRALPVYAVSDVGIIPADAGNTPAGPAGRRSDEDHPRGCVEHYTPIRDIGLVLGSSPRMRGTLPAGRGFALKIGIIPADAGNTFVLELRQKLAPDHPRGCGEHYRQL